MDVLAASKLMPAALQRASRVLFVANTFGEGEPPDGASSFARMLDDELPLTGTSFGVLGLGDRLCDAYCEFGQRIEEWLSRNGARPLFSTNRRRQCRPGSACAVA